MVGRKKTSKRTVKGSKTKAGSKSKTKKRTTTKTTTKRTSAKRTAAKTAKRTTKRTATKKSTTTRRTTAKRNTAKRTMKRTATKTARKTAKRTTKRSTVKKKVKSVELLPVSSEPLYNKREGQGPSEHVPALLYFVQILNIFQTGIGALVALVPLVFMEKNTYEKFHAAQAFILGVFISAFFSAFDFYITSLFPESYLPFLKLSFAMATTVIILVMSYETFQHRNMEIPGINLLASHLQRM